MRCWWRRTCERRATRERTMRRRRTSVPGYPRSISSGGAGDAENSFCTRAAFSRMSSDAIRSARSSASALIVSSSSAYEILGLITRDAENASRYRIEFRRDVHSSCPSRCTKPGTFADSTGRFALSALRKFVDSQLRSICNRTALFLNFVHLSSMFPTTDTVLGGAFNRRKTVEDVLLPSQTHEESIPAR